MSKSLNQIALDAYVDAAVAEFFDGGVVMSREHQEIFLTDLLIDAPLDGIDDLKNSFLVSLENRFGIAPESMGWVVDFVLTDDENAEALDAAYERGLADGAGLIVDQVYYSSLTDEQKQAYREGFAWCMG